MLATLSHERFSREGWMFERKFDGERCLAFCTKSGVRLYSRNRKSLNETYPEIADALSSAPEGVLDGEVVAFEGKQTSFAKLQQRMQIHDAEAARRTGVAVIYYVFDLPFLSGRDLRGLPLAERKRLLFGAVDWRDPVRYTEHRDTEGEKFYEQACDAGWEGLIAKLAISTYTSGRSRDWLKFKCSNQQEFVIGGWTEPQGSRLGFGALLVGYWEAGKLAYAGKVGTGYTERILRTLAGRMRKIETGTAPFSDGTWPRKGVHWLKPELVCEVAFTEWTTDGKLRHPRFVGLRDDKDARDVVRER